MSISKLFKKKSAPQTPLLGSTAADMERAKQEVMAGPERPTELPAETDPNIIEMQRQQRRMALKRKGVASTILSGGQLGDTGYSSGTVLG